MSRPPKARTAPSIIASMPAGCPASAAMATAVPPARAISPATPSAFTLSMSATATWAPRAARPIAVARPIPDPAPETSATLPSKRIAVLQLPRLEGARLLERHDGLHARAERRPAAGDARGLDRLEQLALGGAVLDGAAHVGDHALQAAAKREDADDDHLAVLHRQLLAFAGRQCAERLARRRELGILRGEPLGPGIAVGAAPCCACLRCRRLRFRSRWGTAIGHDDLRRVLGHRPSNAAECGCCARCRTRIAPLRSDPARRRAA